MVFQARLAPAARSTWHGRLLRAALERLARRISIGSLTVEFPGGERRTFGNEGAEPRASLRVLDERLYRKLLLVGEVGFGEAYVDELFATDDLVSLVALGILNRRSVDLGRFRAGWPARLWQRSRHLRRSNTRERARRNIAAHYDLPVEFFRLFLDPTLTYSCAVWEDLSQSLEEAQQAKHRRLLAKAALAPGSRVLEIGSGWGELALAAVREQDCKVTTITISAAQSEVVRQRAEAEGLSRRVEVRLQDYRDVAGVFDAVFSTELLEAVGAE